MSGAKVMSGGCQCGAVRYCFAGAPGPAEICHCRMCQKAAGNLGLVLIRLDADKLGWTRGRPREFRSSAIVSRGFCERCGTPLYMREDGDPQIEITIGSLDDPNAVRPNRAVGVESKLAWFDTLAGLPAWHTDEDRAPEDLAKLTSLQHPDHDAPGGHGVDDAADSSPWRRAVDQDFDRIVEMNARLNAEDPGEMMPFDATLMRRTLAELRANSVRGAVAVLAHDGQCRGYALLISFWSNEFGGEVCAIDELYIEPEVRGCGFASQLIESLARGDCPVWPRRPAMISTEVYRTNPRAKALYERLGFRPSPNHVLTFFSGRRAE